MHVYANACIHAMHAWMYVCMYVCVPVYVHASMHTCMYNACMSAFLCGNSAGEADDRNGVHGSGFRATTGCWV